MPIGSPVKFDAMRKEGCLSISVLMLAVWFCSCGAANRALLHPDDQKKVFPWPEGQKSVSVRVKPLTSKVKIFPFAGEWQTVEVTSDTTFFITEQTGGEFAYTPNRSPISRLAPVEKIHIRWPPPAPVAKTPMEEKTTEGQPEKSEEGKTQATDPAAEKPKTDGGKQ